jgi:hypothetical protein
MHAKFHQRCGDMLDVFQQGTVTLELEALIGTFEAVGVGCPGAAMAGAVVGFDDAAVGEPAAAVVVASAAVLALFPGHSQSLRSVLCYANRKPDSNFYFALPSVVRARQVWGCRR